MKWNYLDGKFSIKCPLPEAIPAVGLEPVGTEGEPQVSFMLLGIWVAFLAEANYYFTTACRSSSRLSVQRTKGLWQNASSTFVE